jgi:Uncharacterized conserved protein
MSYKVTLRDFEGPFDLLVYLIENAQMSIYDIRISEITSQYLAYIRTMKALDFNVTSDFMVLAATLIDIKSRMILPRNNAAGEMIFEEDPRSELVERLLEYKKFRACADMLRDREEKMSYVFEKPQEDISEYLEQPDIYLSLDIDEFAKAFDLFLLKKKRVEEVSRHYTRIEREKASVESRMRYISNTFIKAYGRGVRRISFRELVPNAADRYDVVVSFVAVLQMMRDRYLDAEQNSLYGEITVLAGKRKMKEKPESEQQENDQIGI